MRYEEAYKSRFHGVYSTLAGWCNQPAIFNKFSYREYCMCKGMGNKYSIYKRDFERYINDGNSKGAAWRYMEEFESEAKEIAKQYYDN